MNKSISNLRPGRSICIGIIRSWANTIRSFLYFNLRARYVKRHGMVRIPWNVVMWSPHRDIELGNRVQFGPHCVIECDISIGNDVLMGRDVFLIGRDDHRFDIPGCVIWDSPRGDSYKTYIGNDVWIGSNVTVLGGVKIGDGSNRSWFSCY